MKKLKSGVCLLLLFAILCLAACGGGDAVRSAAAGTYNGIYYKFVGDTDDARVSDEEFSLVLEPNGKGTFKRDGEEFGIEWKLDGESFTMKESFLGISIDYSGTLKGDILDIFNGDPGSVFTCEYVLKK